MRRLVRRCSSQKKSTHGTAIDCAAFRAGRIGGALIGAGAASLPSEVTAIGGILIAVGFFVSTFLGTPLWAEWARFCAPTPDPVRRVASKRAT